MDRYAEQLRASAPPGVRLVGPRHGAARDVLLSHARALVLPSLLEGFPLVPLEAMAAGLPVLLSDIAPHRELLRGVPEAGWLVPHGAWAAALSRLRTVPPLSLSARGSQGKKHVLEHYSWDEIARRTLQVYRDALREAHRLV